MGVFHPDLVGIQVRALQRLGAEHAVVVYGRDGMDEVSLGAATLVGELKNGEITEYEIHPEDFGMPMASNRALKVETPEQSRAMLMGVLDNQPGARATSWCSTPVWRCMPPTWRASRSRTACSSGERRIESGAAKARLAQFVSISNNVGRLNHVRHPRQDRGRQA
jgi:anthranilate phosphoribosyltransferase